MDQIVNDADKVVPPTEDAPPEPVEVEIEAAEGQEPPAADTTPKPAKQPSRRDQRVQNALQAAQEAEARAQAAEERARQAEERAQRAQADAQAATASGMANYAQRIRSEAESAQAELEQALASGDAAAIAKANRKVAKAAAAEADVEAWESSQTPSQQQPQPQAPQQQPQAQQEPAQVPLPPHIAAFVVENNWFNPFQVDAQGRVVVDRAGNKIPNPEFDPEMHDAAMLLNRKVERQIRLGKLPANYQSTQEYVDGIMADMMAQFPDAFGEEEVAPAPPARRAPPMAPSRQPVAPATRGAPPGRTPASQKITLDGETASFVRTMVDNGTMRYPRNHPDPAKRGMNMSYDDAYKEYARQQRLQPQQTQN